MSVFPVFTSLGVSMVLIGGFCWKLEVVCVGCLILFTCLAVYLLDTLGACLQFEAGFWLFIVSEVIIFGTLIFCCLYYDMGYCENLSSALELPFLGCFVLLGSSVTVTGFHHVLGWFRDWVFLVLTILLGGGFVCLQFVEMGEIIMNLFDSRFYASRFCTVGLHFSHVLVGLMGLITCLVVGSNVLGVYRCSIITWYWHFVDYVWLFVYTFVYVC